MDGNIKAFREQLEKNRIFSDYLSTFLNLPIFARRLTYFAASKSFDVEPKHDSQIYTIDPDCVIAWVYTRRLPLFFKSELFYEYKLCHALNCNNEALDESCKGVLASAAAMYDFKRFMFRSEGEVMYMFWMDVEHMKCHQSQFYIRKIIIRISQTYIADGSPFQLHSSLREGLVSVQKAGDPQNKWNMNQQIKELVRCQGKVLKSLREYWCIRYALREAGKRSQDTTTFSGRFSTSSLKSQGSSTGKLSPPSRPLRSISDDAIRRFSIATKKSDSDETLAKLTLKSSSVEAMRTLSAASSGEASDGKMSDSTSTQPSASTQPSEDLMSKHVSKMPRESIAESEHLPPVVSSETVLRYSSEGLQKEKTKKALHIKMSSHKVPLLYSGINKERTFVAQAVSNDTMARSVILSKADPNTLLSSSTYDLFSDSSNSLLRLDLREGACTGAHLEPYLSAALRADFTAGNPFQRYLKTTCRNPEAVSYMLFWQSIENILSQDEMRRWYTIKYLRSADKEEDEPSPYLSYFEPYLVAKDLRELCLFFLQPKSLHKVELPQDIERKLNILLPKGLGQGLLLAAQEYVIEKLLLPWEEFLFSDYEMFVRNCTTEKFAKKVSKCHRIDSISIFQATEDIYTAPKFLHLDSMWDALKFSEAIKYIGIQELPSRNITEVSLHRLCSEVHPQEAPMSVETGVTPDDETVERLNLCTSITTITDVRKWDMTKNKHIRSVLCTVTPSRLNIGGKRIKIPKNMLEVLRDKEHLEYFRLYLSQRGAKTSYDAPLEFWLAVEDLKLSSNNSRRFETKLKRIVERFLKGDTSRVLLSDKPIPTDPPPDLFKLIAAQTNVRLAIEKKWLDKYVEYLETEDKKRKEQERRWREEHRRLDAQKRELAKKKKALEKSRARKHLWELLAQMVARFKRDLMNSTTCLMFQKFLFDEVVRKATNKKLMSSTGKTFSVSKLLRDLGFWAEVERYKDLVTTIKEGQKSGAHTPEDFITVHKKAHAIVNCYLDSTINPSIQVNVSPEIVDNILEKVSKGKITYGLFHDAAMETFHILFAFWKKFCQHRISKTRGGSDVLQTIGAHRSTAVKPEVRGHSSMSAAASHSNYWFDGGPILAFSLSHGLRWLFPSLRQAIPVPYCDYEILPNSDSYPSLEDILGKPSRVSQATRT